MADQAYSDADIAYVQNGLTNYGVPKATQWKLIQ